MAQMAKVTINWTGFPGAPGFTNLYFRDFSGPGTIDQAVVDGAVTKADAWLAAWKASLPNSVTTGVDPNVEAIEETTGELQAFFTGSPAAASVGTGGVNYASPVGAVVSWYTNVVRNGRRIRGRSFMVPLSTTAYESDGSLVAGKLAPWLAASEAMLDPLGVGDFGIWSRPTLLAPASGIWALASSVKIPDMAAVLTSRRS